MHTGVAYFVRSKKDVYGLALQRDIPGRSSYCSGKVLSLHRHLLHAFILTYFGVEVLASMWAG